MLKSFSAALGLTRRMCDVRNFFGNSAGCKLFFNERDSDVAIKVEWEGSTWHFPAHKLVLSTMSEVFRIMLEIDMMEKNSKAITICDSPPLTVKQFLKYLYMGVLDFNGWLDALHLLKIAHKYRVQTLVNLCETHLLTTIGFSNACTLYELALMYSLKILKREAQTFILDTGFIVSSTEGFFTLKVKSLEYFLGNTRLNLENEGSLLTSLREWAICECSRKGLALSGQNVLHEMAPLLKYIRWNCIPEGHRTFVPKPLVEKYGRNDLQMRRSFHVPSCLQFHVHILKFIVELGAFNETKITDSEALNCLKFGIDNHAFIAGFRIVGMFRLNCALGNGHSGHSSLTLGRDDNKLCLQFNLNSLPWTRGATVGDYVWREMIAYLPYPVRVDPFSSYQLKLRYGSRSTGMTCTKWPSTRLENGFINSDLGLINFQAYGSSYGITQLFILPAPPYRNICNDPDS